jgi:hypothetical protein
MFHGLLVDPETTAGLPSLGFARQMLITGVPRDPEADVTSSKGAR